MNENVLVAGVFDGHRGSDASEFLAANFERLLGQFWTSSKSPADLLVSVLRAAEDEFRTACELSNSCSAQLRYPGTTALCMVLCDGTLTIANIGDSRAMLCRGGKAIELTEDHVLRRDAERARIEQSGQAAQMVQHGESWRLGSIGLAITRSIGDLDMKHVLIADPEITEMTILKGDEFVVLATDGVWDVMSGDRMVSIIHDTVKQPAMCAQRLVHTAVNEMYSKDNATAIVCFLNEVSTFQRLTS